MSLPTATQTLTATGLIRRTAICPEHQARSSRYLGATAQGWLFACLTRDHPRHTFFARPARDAPRTEAEIAAWREKQLADRLKDVRKSGA